MEKENQRLSRFGDGFALVPLGKCAREGEIARWPDAWLSVLVILISFENKKPRKSYPSLDTLAALGGISKENASNAILLLQNNKWLTSSREPSIRGRQRYVYTMLYPPYVVGAGEGNNWISVYDDVIKSGVWAVMPPSARKLFLVMKAFAMEGFYANTGWVGEYTSESYSNTCHDFAEDFDFMPASVLDGFGRDRPTLAALCGIAERTFRDAKNWLTDNELMHFYEGDYCTGLAFPHQPKRYAPKVLEALENKKKLQSEAIKRGCTGHATKRLRAIKVRSKQASQRGGDPRLGRRERGSAADSELLKSIE